MLQYIIYWYMVICVEYLGTCDHAWIYIHIYLIYVFTNWYVCMIITLRCGLCSLSTLKLGRRKFDTRELRLTVDGFLCHKLGKHKLDAMKDLGPQFNDLFINTYFYLYFRVLCAGMSYVGPKNCMCASIHMHKVIWLGKAWPGWT